MCLIGLDLNQFSICFKKLHTDLIIIINSIIIACRNDFILFYKFYSYVTTENQTSEYNSVRNTCICQDSLDTCRSYWSSYLPALWQVTSSPAVTAHRSSAPELRHPHQSYDNRSRITTSAPELRQPFQNYDIRTRITTSAPELRHPHQSYDIRTRVTTSAPELRHPHQNYDIRTRVTTSAPELRHRFRQDEKRRDSVHICFQLRLFPG